MALVIVMIFSMILLALFGAIAYQHRSVAQRNRINLRDQQAFFAARAAMQHFLLKARLLPTELYDAVAFSLGKNPYMDFAESTFRNESNQAQFEPRHGLYRRIDPATGLPTELVPNTSVTRFFYVPIKMKGSEPDVLVRVASFYNPQYRYLSPNIAPTTLPEKYIAPNNSAYATDYPDKFLEYFYRDCTNDIVNSGRLLQPALVFDKAPGIENEQSWSIIDSGFPYQLTYRVKSISLKTLEGLRRYNEEAIEVEFEGEVVDFQNNQSSRSMNQVRRITRTGHHID